MGVLSKIGNAVKTIASATIGIPLALAATATMVVAGVMLKGVNELHKMVFNEYNSYFNRWEDAIFGSIGSVWTKFGISTYLQAAEKTNNLTAIIYTAGDSKQSDDVDHAKIAAESDKKEKEKEKDRPVKNPKNPSGVSFLDKIKGAIFSR